MVDIPGLPASTGSIARSGVAVIPGLPAAPSQPDAGGPPGIKSMLSPEQLANTDAAASQAAQQQANIEAWREQQRKMEEKYGAAGTVALQGARGFLDGLLAPGALVGAGVEGLGHLTGAQGLEDFGRGLGESAQGSEALAQIAWAAGSSAGHKLDSYDGAKRVIREQEQAFPLLSAASRVGGAVGFAAATGGLAGAAIRGPGAIAAGAAEGAGFGAQAAYENNAAGTEVLTSLIIGAALGGAAVGGGQLISKGLEKRAAAKAQREIAEAAWGDTKGAVKNPTEAFGREAGEVLADVFEAERRTAAAAKNAQTIEGRITAERQILTDASDAIAKKAGDYNARGWADKPPNAWQKFTQRKQILDAVSQDAASDAAKLASLRVSPDIKLSTRALGSLFKSVDDKPALVGKMQKEFLSVIGDVPDAAVGSRLRDVAQGMSGKRLTTAFSEAHETVKYLDELSRTSTDDLAQWAKSSSARVKAAMTSPEFGKAGNAYRVITEQSDAALKNLSDKSVARAALANMQERGELVKVFREETRKIANAHDAAALLTGKRSSVQSELIPIVDKIAKAEDAVLVDGGSPSKVIEYLKGQLKSEARDTVRKTVGAAFAFPIGHAIGGPVGGFVATGILNTVTKKLESLAPVLLSKAKGVGAKAATGAGPSRLSKTAAKAARTAGKAARRGITPAAARATSLAESNSIYSARLKKVNEIVSNADLSAVDNGLLAVPALPAAMAASVSIAYQEKLVQLQADMPKPSAGVRGELPLSHSDVRLGNSMYEATVDPLSVFEDFADGSLDPDKATYAWKQWPELRELSVLGLQDMLYAQMEDDERATIPESLLTKLDILFQMNGQLSSTISASFTTNIDQIQADTEAAQEEATRQAQGRGLQLPQSEQTFTQRVAGA